MKRGGRKGGNEIKVCYVHVSTLHGEYNQYVLQTWTTNNNNGKKQAVQL